MQPKLELFGIETIPLCRGEEGETTKKKHVFYIKNGKNATFCISNVQHLLLTKDRAPTFYLR